MVSIRPIGRLPFLPFPMHTCTSHAKAGANPGIAIASCTLSSSDPLQHRATVIPRRFVQHQIEAVTSASERREAY
jgi:hypothetical protein